MNELLLKQGWTKSMINTSNIPEPVGETTDVETWLSRAGLKFEDLDKDPISVAIRRQWREYQTAVHRCCVALHKTPERVQLGGVYAKLRIPNGASLTEFKKTLSKNNEENGALQ